MMTETEDIHVELGYKTFFNDVNSGGGAKSFFSPIGRVWKSFLGLKLIVKVAIIALLSTVLLLLFVVIPVIVAVTTGTATETPHHPPTPARHRLTDSPTTPKHGGVTDVKSTAVSTPAHSSCSWTAWSACSDSCGSGSQVRQKGSSCVGTKRETRACADRIPLKSSGRIIAFDKVMDHLVDMADETIRGEGGDPLMIPDFSKTYSKKIVFIPVSITVHFKDISISGLSNLKRVGEVTLSVTPDRIDVSAHLGIRSVSGSITLATSFFSVKGSVAISEIDFQLDLSFDLVKGSTSLKDFKVTRMSTAQIRLSLGSSYDWILNYVLDLLSKLYHDKILGYINDAMRKHAVEANLHKVRISSPVPCSIILGS